MSYHVTTGSIVQRKCFIYEHVYCLIYICVAYVGIFAALDVAQYKFDYAQNIYTQVHHIGVCNKLRKLKVRKILRTGMKWAILHCHFTLDFIVQ